MTAESFIASAQAAAGPLFEPGASVGERIEAAVDATWAVAGCNTNLGILLLCAPIARAVELRRRARHRHPCERPSKACWARSTCLTRRRPSAPSPGPARAAWVRRRTRMSGARRASTCARRWRLRRTATASRASTGTAIGDLFDLGLPTLGSGFSLMATSASDAPDAGTVAAVQRLYLALLGSVADSHIVRIHGEAVAHIVMTAAQGWRVRARRHGGLDADPNSLAWDASLKADGINPGTTADLTVAALLIAGLAGPSMTCAPCRSERVARNVISDEIAPAAIASVASRP